MRWKSRNGVWMSSVIALALWAVTPAELHAQPPEFQPPEFQVNVATEFRQHRPDVAMDAYGRFVVVWADNKSHLGVIRARRFAAHGAASGDVLLVDDTVRASQNPSVTMAPSGESFLVLWERYYGVGLELAPPPVEAVGSIPGHKCQPVPADAWARRYAADGTPLSEPFQVDSPHNTRLAPEAAIHSSGEFVVVWQEYVGFLTFHIRARRYAADATPQGEAFTVNTYPRGFQVAPKVVLDDEGGFLVVWEAEEGVRARRFNAEATPATGEVEISTTTGPLVNTTAVGRTGTGRFLVTWSEFDRDAAASSIRGLFLDPGGLPTGTELELAVGEAGFNHDLTVSRSGEFAVVWSGSGVHSDGSGSGIGARVFKADGSGQATSFQVNTYTTNDQSAARVAMDSSGNLVAVWHSRGSLGDDQSELSIQARRLALAITDIPTLSGLGLAVLAVLTVLGGFFVLRSTAASKSPPPTSRSPSPPPVKATSGKRA